MGDQVGAIDQTARFEPADLYASPNALAAHYRDFRVAERLLLTGHSHQAWPDVARRGLELAWRDAADQVDDKWDRARERADRVRRGYARLLDDGDGLYALASSVHDLIVRLLSALPLSERPRVVTTDAEFYSFERQLRRLEEEGIEAVRVAAEPAESIGERMAQALCERTAMAYLSTVFFENGLIAGGLGELVAACRRIDVPLVLDVYHHLNVVPFSLPAHGLEDAFVVGGGYKYCQLGEGNCFLRFPADCEMRPAVTGWFAAFGSLTDQPSGKVLYDAGHNRFAGATYDPVSHYRGAEVFDFFDQHELTVELLREVSQHQIGLLIERFDDLDLDPRTIARETATPLDRLGGFLALDSPRAGDIHAGLRERGVLTDFRGTTLRLGPAPYLSDQQLRDAVGLLGAVVRGLE